MSVETERDRAEGAAASFAARGRFARDAAKGRHAPAPVRHGRAALERQMRRVIAESGRFKRPE